MHCRSSHPEVTVGRASGKVIVMSVPCSSASPGSESSQPPPREADHPADTLLAQRRPCSAYPSLPRDHSTQHPESQDQTHSSTIL